MPEHYSANITVDRDAWVEALKPIQAIARQARCPVIRVTWEAKALSMEIDEAEIGRAATQIRGRGGPREPIRASFSARHLLDLTRSFPPGRIRFAWSGDEMPVAATQGDLLHLVLPLRH